MSNNATVHPIFDKHKEAPTPEHVVVHNEQPIQMGKDEYQTFLNRLEFFSGQGINFVISDSGEVGFDIPEGTPQGIRVVVKQFQAKTVWMALLRSTIEEAMGHTIEGGGE